MMAVVGVSETEPEIEKFDLDIFMTEGISELKEEFLTLCHLVPAQLFGYYKSLNLGFDPDSPSSGAIHRVVQGVTIYDFNLEN